MVAAGAVGEAVWLAEGMDASSLVLANVLKATRTVNYNLAATPEETGEVGLVPEYALLPTLGLAQDDRAYIAPSDHTAVLRYTWLPSTDAVADSKRAAALNRLLDAFTSPEALRAYAVVGLRGPDGVRPTGGGADRLPEVTAKPFDVFGPHHVEHVFATWDPEDRRSNLLIVVDVASPPASSSSPTPSGTVRQQAIDVLRQGCRLLGDLMPDGARLGLWEVGASAGSPQTYRTVVPTGRLDAAHRATLDRAVGGLTVRRAGPGLYDAIVEAYRSVQNDYKADMFNQVLVLTDDQNKDSANAQALQRLVDQLNQLRDPERPVTLSMVVLGQKAAADRLKTSLKPVDAYVGNAVGAADVQAVFIHVVAGGLHD